MRHGCRFLILKRSATQLNGSTQTHRNNKKFRVSAIAEKNYGGHIFGQRWRNPYLLRSKEHYDHKCILPRCFEELAASTIA
jgi:hypothetical protein